MGNVLTNIIIAGKALTIGDRMVIDRLVAAEPYRIAVGVTGQTTSPTNPMAEQVIRIGENGPLRPLVAFTEANNSLQYEFEGNVKLQISKRENGEVVYHLKTPEIQYTDKMYPVLRRQKAISLKSAELDKIFPLIAEVQSASPTVGGQ